MHTYLDIILHIGNVFTNICCVDHKKKLKNKISIAGTPTLNIYFCFE